ncbi:MAG TPA: alpha/beta hydrolase [Polyangiaceae bacterium]|nr:alpha/beta hydrolase [Polyangiaceae bacterium]
MPRRRLPFLFAFALAAASGCGPAPGAPAAPSQGAPAASSQGAPADDGVCAEREALFDGGAMLRADDGVSLWYKVAGNAGGPTLAYVHGGPCFGSLDFEKSAGPALERSARVVYFDQRGCRRSAAGATEANLTMAASVEGLERLRRHLALERLNLVAHSAGGWVAVEYAKRHPERVGRLVLVDTSGAFQRSVQIASTTPLRSRRTSSPSTRLTAALPAHRLRSNPSGGSWHKMSY